MKAFCWHDGVIHFRRSVPKGAFEIVSAPAKKLRKAVAGTARLAYDNKTWLVPGGPEALDVLAIRLALTRYQDFIARRLS